VAVATEPFAGFAAEDFAVFSIEGFEGRMAALRGHLRPRLVAMADALAPALGDALGVTLYPHVAAHLRRTVNPPPETWAAFGPDRRRYKAYAHYAVGIDGQGAWFFLVLKDEALADRQALSRALGGRTLGAVLRTLPDELVVRTDGGEHAVHDRRALAGDRERLLRKGDAQWGVGRRVGAGSQALASAAGVQRTALETFTALAPVWRALPSSPWRIGAR